MQKVTIRYGLNSLDRTFNVPVSIGQLRRDQTIRAALGYGDNINLLMNGVAMCDDAIVPNGGIVTVETAANQKAS